QQVCDQRPAVQADGGEERGRPSIGVRVRRRGRRRERRPGLLRGLEASRGQGSRWRRAHPHRAEDLPLPPSHLRRRRSDLPLSRGGRGGEAERLDRGVRKLPEGAGHPGRRRDRRVARRDQSAGRRRGGRGVGSRGSVGPERTPARVPGEPVTEKNIVQTVHDTLWDAMKLDERVMVLGEDVGARGGVFRATAGFLEEFGEKRVIDTPLAESSIVGVAIGMAMHGLLPVAEPEFADFIHPAFDQMVSEAARIRYRSDGDWNCPMVVRTPWGGGVHGALYHSQSIEAFYGHVPGLKVVVPSTPYDVKGMLLAAINDPDPVLFLEHKKTYRLIKGEVPDERYEVPIGPADVKR